MSAPEDKEESANILAGICYIPTVKITKCAFGYSLNYLLDPAPDGKFHIGLELENLGWRPTRTWAERAARGWIKRETRRQNPTEHESWKIR